MSGRARKKIAVIGAGLGGLTAACRLARAGYEVALYEQQPVTGGKAGELCAAGYRFDTGPSLLTMPFVFQEHFSRCGCSMAEHLPIKQLKTITKYFFSDGTVLNAYGDGARLLREIKEKTGEDPEHVARFLKYARCLYDRAATLFLYNSPHEIFTYLQPAAWRALAAVPFLDFHRTMFRAIQSYFKDPRLVQLFCRYATYNGSSPYRAPATLNLIPHVEYTLGAYYPTGGIAMIPRALTDLARQAGVTMCLGRKVKQIVVSRGRVRGVQVDGEQRKYDAVISNVDVRTTYRDLLRDTSSTWARRYEGFEPASSGMVFYWGVNRMFSELDVNNIFFNADYQEEFIDLFANRTMPADPTVYVNISSKYRPADAPDGKENWFVLVNAPTDSGQDWAQHIAKTRARVLARLRKALGVDISALIEYEKVMTPQDLAAQTGSFGGSIYGIASNCLRAAFARHPNRSREYRGLYFCGGSAHPGGGMPLAVLSGRITEGIISRHGI